MPRSARGFAGDGDYRAMRDLVAEVYARSGPPVDCTLGDLDWWRATAEGGDGAAPARLWLDAGDRLVGFAWPGGSQIDLVVDPEAVGIEDEMLAWAEAERRRPAPETPELTAWAYEGDPRRTAILERRGYHPTGEILFFRVRELEPALPEPEVTAGYRLGHVMGEMDLARRVAVHRAAFAPSRMTEAKHRAVMRSPTYRPELDVVAEAPDGSLAAFALVWHDERNRAGTFEPVGCHPDHRGRGLGRAVVLEGMRRLAARGARTAIVGGFAGDAEPSRLYESVGFRVIGRNRAWRKSLAAVDPR